MLIGVVSDTHNRVKHVEKIVNLFNSYELSLVVHTGDITNAKTLDLFSDLNFPLKGVYGNNDINEPGLINHPNYKKMGLISGFLLIFLN